MFYENRRDYKDKYRAGVIKYRKNKFFFSRLNQNAGRCVQYYGKRWKYLLNDVTQNFPYFYPQIKVLLQLIQKEIKNKHSTIFAYTHRDLHDFNFSYDGLFWDLDTFNINPITNDFAIYYWHFFAREDFLILKYNPWLSRYMHNYLEVDFSCNIE